MRAAQPPLMLRSIARLSERSAMRPATRPGVRGPERRESPLAWLHTPFLRRRVPRQVPDTKDVAGAFFHFFSDSGGNQIQLLLYSYKYLKFNILQLFIKFISRCTRAGCGSRRASTQVHRHALADS